MIQGTNNKMPQIQDPRKFFIIYKRDSAWDFAKHLHDSLHERGVDVFLDTEDLKEGLSKEEWRKRIDKAIEDAEVIIFIVTHSASKSDEIRYELSKAREIAKADIRPFIDDRVWNMAKMTKSLVNRELNKNRW